jgi:hypothetical protein
MKRIIAIFAVGLACAIAMSSARAAPENNAQHRSSAAGSPVVVAQANVVVAQANTEADKKNLSDEIQKRYKPGSGRNTPMSSGATNTCGGTGQIAACAASCAAACIFSCSPFPKGNTPWSATCHNCVNPCMDKCTGCGSGTLQ